MEKNKKKPVAAASVVKKSGFVTNANAKPRPITDDEQVGVCDLIISSNGRYQCTNEYSNIRIFSSEY